MNLKVLKPATPHSPRSLLLDPLVHRLPGRKRHAILRGTTVRLPRASAAAVFSFKGVDHDGIPPAAEGLAVACAGHGAGRAGHLDQRRGEGLATVALWGSWVFADGRKQQPQQQYRIYCALDETAAVIGDRGMEGRNERGGGAGRRRIHEECICLRPLNKKLKLTSLVG